MTSGRYFRSIAVILVVLGNVCWVQTALCQANEPAQEKQLKKAFMQTVIAAIDAYNNKKEAARKKAEKLAGRPLGGFTSLPRITPFGDWDFYYLEDELKYQARDREKIKDVNVPKGFVTDLASVPSLLWAKYPPTGRYAYATIVHDYLYWTQERERSEADAVLKDALRDSRVDSTTVAAFHLAVTSLGANSWNANIKAKMAGEKRFLIRFPEDRLTSWADWRKQPNVFKD